MYNWFTPVQVQNIFARLGLTEADVQLHVYGNLMSRIAFQVNLPAEELTEQASETPSIPGSPC